ncbi:MAG: hypothetical protein ACTHNQ_03800 [Microbacterium sp.]|uniref:hypothetical protein n=1 Tax=Microbacterium sp. TaxID=51671 RepID=UPI003F80ED4C
MTARGLGAWLSEFRDRVQASNPAWSDLRVHNRYPATMLGTLSAIHAAVGPDPIWLAHLMPAQLDADEYTVLVLTERFFVVAARHGTGTHDVTASLYARSALLRLQVENAPTIVGDGLAYGESLAVRLFLSDGTNYLVWDRNGHLERVMHHLRDAVTE